MKDVFAKIPITKQVEISTEAIAALFECAVEGGSNYWCVKIRPLDKDDDRSYNEYMLEGFYAWEEEASDENGPKRKVTKAQIEKALKIMAEKYPYHALNIMDDDGGVSSQMDSETGDVFLQCCCFGELVYN